MSKFPVIITEVKNFVVTSKTEMLESNRDITKKSVRTKAINDYIKLNLNNRYSLCWDCKTPILNCDKMCDISKKMIYDYPFIMEGYQIQDMYEAPSQTNYKDADISTCEFERTSRCNDLRIEKFIVSKCKNFKGIKRY